MGILTSFAQVTLALFSTILPFIVLTAVPGVAAVYLSCRRRTETHHSRSPEGKTTEKSKTQKQVPDDGPDVPVSVNYFPSRECNYACGFCFHTNTSGYILPLDEAKRGLRLLRDAGMRKLNIAGGEPFLHPKFLGELLRYCKEVLHLESVSIVSNGSKIRERFLREHGRHLDILAISCDSFVRETNRAIGRGENQGRGQADDGDHVAQVFRIAEWCRTYDIMFKLNTVVNAHNWDEDMAARIAALAPFRWKVFQCLIVEGENEDATRARDARRFLISEAQWRTFCGRHEHLPCYVPEDNRTMAGSYLLLDERMRFLDKGDGPMRKSDSLLDVGVKKAMRQVAWDRAAFDKRGGIYEWRKPQTEGGAEGGCGGGDKKELEW
ncbi:radical s-adenosyl methionine domain-containing protein 2 [Colletotrichum karsti]|uniref:Radical s-adenosyl methionine domain-containing protein 2 n=1 Tax=Colletotrichum karsti TaxID=1095194 RepID=A0A9P6LGH6_9PEZI|nr:radical s-adenosyl methionine domain-containing protein 2 [Colletotrichum karsti]KAF9871590.1 radical s-adenosyl methionine domain-containing protein 2 [Colletotrichum karsti]